MCKTSIIYEISLKKFAKTRKSHYNRALLLLLLIFISQLEYICTRTQTV